MLAASALALLLLAPGAQGAAGQRSSARGLRVALLSCATAKPRVAARLGCSTIPGAGGRDSALEGLTALATTGSRTSLYTVDDRNSALAQFSLGPSRALSFAACLTGNSFIHTCAPLPGATANASPAPVAFPTGIAVSPDGRSLYVVSGNFHGAVVARFARDPLTGALAYQGCLTGDLRAGPSTEAACSPLPTATADGNGSGLFDASGIAIDPDSTHVYVTTARDGGVVAFDRDPASGALSFVGCVNSSRSARGCARAPGSILSGIGSPVVSPDGRYLYAAAGASDTVSAFRLGGAAALRFAGCVTSRDNRPPCRQGRRPEGAVAALSNPSGLAVTADGSFLYASSIFGEIVALRRNRATGALTPVSCISSRREDRRRCARVPASPQRVNGNQKVSLLVGVHAPLLLSRDRRLVAPVGTLDGLVELNRNRRTGALGFRGCATGDLSLSTARRGPCQALPKATGNGAGSGLYKTAALAPAPGNLFYAAAWGDATVSLLRP